MPIRITYDGNAINLKVGAAGLTIQRMQEKSTNRSWSGKTETISSYFIHEIDFDSYFEETVRRQLIAWWSYARTGQSFSFAKDSDAGANTTLDGAATASQAVIPLTATTGFEAGDVCLIKTANDSDFEVIEIQSVSDGVSVTATTNLINTYASGDSFRHEDYFPDVIVSRDFRFDPRQEGGIFSQMFSFVENK